MPFPKIDFFLTIYKESSPEDLALLDQAIEGIKKQQISHQNPFTYQICVIHAYDTPKALLDFCHTRLEGFPFVFWERPDWCEIDGYSANLKGIVWAYNTKSTADYIALNHSDDISYPTRLHTQLQSLYQFPSAGISLAGFHYCEKDQLPKSAKYILNPNNGFNYGIPSGWMINRKSLPILSYNITIPVRDDAILLATILQQIPIVSIELELFAYHAGRTLNPSNYELNVRTWHEYVAWWKTHNTNLHDVYLYYETRRIMVIGLFADWYEGGLFATQLEKCGCSVIRIAADKIEYKLFTQNQGKVDHLLDQIQNKEEKAKASKFMSLISVYPYVEKYQPECIFLMQHNLGLDFAHVSVPIYYWISEATWKQWPYSTYGIPNIKGVFHAFLGSSKTYRNIHTYQMNLLMNREAISTYAWSPEQYPPGDPKLPKKFFFGWMGSTGKTVVEEDPEEDYVQYHMRDLRARFVEYAQKYCGLICKPKGSTEAYRQFMQQCNLALNVPGLVGMINQRQFHAPGMGCVLVQYRYKGIEKLGFEDYVNCLLFDDEQELQAKVHWAEHHPIPLEQIRKAGFELVSKKHQYLHRAQTFLNQIKTWNDIPTHPPEE